MKVHTTLESVKNLIALSKHSTLRQYLQRVVFIQPKFQEQFCHMRAYVTELTKGRFCRSSLQGMFAEGTRTAFRARREKGLRSPLPYTNIELRAGFNAYRGCAAQQEFLLKELYVDLVGDALERFPMFSAVHFLAEEDDLTEHSAWLRKLHPEVLIERTYHSEEDHDAFNPFIHKVFDALNEAGARPRELRFTHRHGIGLGFDWTKVSSLDFLSNLRVLDLSIRAAEKLSENLSQFESPH